MTKNKNPKPSSKSGQKKSSNNQSQPKLNCIICFKDPKPRDKSTKIKFFEANNTEVSEQIQTYKTRDNKANLITLMNRSVSLGNR